VSKYRHLLIAYLPGLALLSALIVLPGVAPFAAVNLGVQLIVFAVFAAVPADRSGRMSYVDIAWPTGLIVLGLELPLFAAKLGAGTLALSIAYLAIGLRMALPGYIYLVRVGPLKGEFARYRYQRLRWQEAGWRGERLPMQLEIFIQALANASVLAVPALLLAADPRGSLDGVSLAAMLAWALCFGLEALADRQKRRFAATAARRATCEIGLWRYSRHPNYFFQWLGWIALALAAAPALGHLPAASGTALAIGLAGAPAFMLWTLLELTGVKPAEHFSAQRRPGYVDYQRSTNRFVPGPRRRAGQPAAEEARA
jgi:steroid 5-alpha reductase family enzyme